jgi:hypothetical protein
MTPAIVLVIAAAVALVIILRLAIIQGLPTKRDANATPNIRPIDLEAFQNLVDPAEDDYLRRRLPPPEFRAVRRARLRATSAYIHAAGDNAAILVQLGESALASGDPRFTSAAKQLVNDALLLRRNTTIASFRIYIAWAWPDSRFAAGKVIERYGRVSGSAMLLGRLQNPGTAIRLSASC